MRLVVSHTVSVVLDIPDDYDQNDVARRMSDNLSVALTQGFISSDLARLAMIDNLPVDISSLTSRPVAS